MSNAHDDFPALLAEALDVMAACASDVRSAAEALGVTASQFTKLLKQEPRAIGAVNEARTGQGQHRLK